MKAIKIQIISFISDDQPGFVECAFTDAWEYEHKVQEKTPIVTKKYLDAFSEYPQDGFIACEITKNWIDKNERVIFTVTTEKPWAVETIDGLTEFDILEEQLIDIN